MDEGRDAGTVSDEQSRAREEINEQRRGKKKEERNRRPKNLEQGR